jgi:23S rRNA (adenine2503-C2)-methyltransferase
MQKKSLIGKTLSQLKEIVNSLGLPTFTAKQIAEWIYKKRVLCIDEMTNISLKNRELLNDQYQVGRYLPIEQTISIDGTKKYLFGTTSDFFIETVYIPEEDRHTLCVSSQIGCKMNCLFCMTGKQGFNGQLTAQGIINQVLSIDEASIISNIVFMGMGEPMDNLTELLIAIEILTSDYGLAWSPKRITVSTIGIIPKLILFLEQTKCHLAISLHSPFSNERLKLMPIEKVYPLNDLLIEIKKHDFSHQRRVSFEYILFDDFNDTMKHARELIRILKGIDCRVNLIKFHAIPNSTLTPSPIEKMTAFRDFLNEHNITTTIRKSRGEDIMAACGMLSTSKNETKPK